MTGFFDRSAAGWDERTGAGSVDHLAGLAVAVGQVEPRPERVLDLGTGTGEAALFLAREYPTASIRGVDVSEAMIAAAKAKVGLDPEGRVAFKVADAARLPYGDDSFDLVTQVNMPPFFAEIARVLRARRPRDRGRRERRGDARSTRRPRCSSAGSRATAWNRSRAAPSAPAPGSSRAPGAGRLIDPVPAGDRHLLLVNPSAGGGSGRRAAAARSSARSRERGLEYRSVLTDGPRARLRRSARAAAAAGETVVVMSGDGLIGQVGGVLADGDAHRWA